MPSAALAPTWQPNIDAYLEGVALGMWVVLTVIVLLVVIATVRKFLSL